MRQKLASVRVGDGREAAIWRGEDGTVTRTAGAEAWAMRVGGSGAPFVLPVPDGTLLLGELPPGAAAVDVRASLAARESVVAEGHYLAVLPGPVSAELVSVLARDATGTIVPWPVEGETKRRALADADVACPACGGGTWDIVHRAGERATVCHTCGWSDGGWTKTGPRRPVVDVVLGTDEAPLGNNPTVAEALTNAKFPVYGLVDDTTDSFSCGWDDEGRVTSIGLVYEAAAVEVRTTIDPLPGAPADRARNALRIAIEAESRADPSSEDLSMPARALRHSVQTRALRARLEATPVDRVTIAVDGRPTEFECQRSDGIEAAAAELDGAAVVIVSRGRPLADLALERL